MGEFRQFLEDHGITSQLAAPGQPQQNGVAERRNITLLDMLRSMMSYASLPRNFWGHALDTAQYILNLVPSKAIPTTPKELWTGRKPSLGHVRIWESPAHVLKRDPSKLEARIDVCMFVGYPRGTKGYMFYDPQDQKVFVSTNARFLEEDYMMNNKSRTKTILDELRDEGIENPVTVTQVHPPLVTSTQERGEPRRSGRVVRQPEHFIGLGEIPEELKMDPNNYGEAIQDKDVTS